jgi:hypothetical protein
MALSVEVAVLSTLSIVCTIASTYLIVQDSNIALLSPSFIPFALLNAHLIAPWLADVLYFAQPLALRDIRAKLGPWMPLSPDLSPMWLARFEDGEYVVRLDTYWEVVFTSTQNVQGVAHYERWKAIRDLLRAGHSVRPVLQLMYGAKVLDVRELTTGEAAP